jgi:hypothetical protein
VIGSHDTQKITELFRVELQQARGQLGHDGMRGVVRDGRTALATCGCGAEIVVGNDSVGKLTVISPVEHLCTEESL